jgi:hypothetical protein
MRKANQNQTSTTGAGIVRLAALLVSSCNQTTSFAPVKIDVEVQTPLPPRGPSWIKDGYIQTTLPRSHNRTCATCRLVEHLRAVDSPAWRRLHRYFL